MTSAVQRANESNGFPTRATRTNEWPSVPVEGSLHLEYPLVIDRRSSLNQHHPTSPNITDICGFQIVDISLRTIRNDSEIIGRFRRPVRDGLIEILIQNTIVDIEIMRARTQQQHHLTLPTASVRWFFRLPKSMILAFRLSPSDTHRPPTVYGQARNSDNLTSDCAVPFSRSRMGLLD
jgi:hypothetical protein